MSFLVKYTLKDPAEFDHQVTAMAALVTALKAAGIDGRVGKGRPDLFFVRGKSLALQKALLGVVIGEFQYPDKLGLFASRKTRVVQPIDPCSL